MQIQLAQHHSELFVYLVKLPRRVRRGELLEEEVAVLEELVGGLGRVGAGGGGGGGVGGSGQPGENCHHQIHQMHQLLHQLRVVGRRPPHTPTLVTLVREFGRLLASTVEVMLVGRVGETLEEEEEVETVGGIGEAVPSPKGFV